MLKNEAMGLESFVHIFGMARMHFLGFMAILESNELVHNQPRYHCNKHRVLNRLVCKVEKKMLWPMNLLDVVGLIFFPYLSSMY
jgi:hypothetical protein